MKSTSRAISNRTSRPVVDREAWLEVARDALIRGGIDSVKIEPLAAQMEISRSSFYWHFKNRRELLDALLEYWKSVNDQALKQAVDAGKIAGKDPEAVARARLSQLIDLFIHEKGFSSQFDMAVREWARKDSHVAAQVAYIDNERIALFQQIFLDAGQSRSDSLARAKILYFHQLGYYLVGIQETAAARMRVAPRYMEILSGLRFSGS